MARNLLTQGYCLTDVERMRRGVGLRFATGLCVALVALSLSLESSALFFVLAAIGAAAGLTPRHPFDLIWNYGVRHGFAALALGAVLLVACSIVTTTNFCLPSVLLSLLSSERTKPWQATRL
jgi:hypothetical protein